jgi:O-antigen ligase
MNPKSTATALKCGAVVFLLFALLFAGGIGATSSGFIGFALRELTAIGQDSATQWMLVFCLAIYFVSFLILELRTRGDTSHLRPANPNVWLAAFVLLSLFRYARAYETASHSIQMPMLLAGIVLGKAMATWARWRSDEIERRAVFLIRSLVYLLAVSAWWQPERSMVFQYHGAPRWSGLWDNPNLYGLLMGAGVVLAAGQIAEARRWTREDGPWRKILRLILSSLAVILCGLGLLKSYSRGAWLAVFVGLIYLAVQAVKSSRFSVWFRRNWFSLALLTTSFFFLAFWQFRFLEQRPAQRLFSAANANDFSWRNRVIAWEGAVRMMMDKPLSGFGWGQAEADYGKKYCPPRLNNENAAIEMNDYLMIGISAGVPAMVCFVACVSLSLRGKPAGLNASSALRRLPAPFFTACRAGAIVLLVGFWFDGGLFKLPVAVVFWTLLELSRTESAMPPPVPPIQETTGNDLIGSMPIVPKRGAWENRLRWLAVILAALAATQTTVYLGTPFLPVGGKTLAIARHGLIQRNENGDFEFLSTNAVWRGQKLKVLLEHVRLANYNRQLINWKLGDKIYQEFVLSPAITGDVHEQLDWRRPLWEEFYPRIRHESSPEDAAVIVVRHLRERVTIAAIPDPPRDIPTIWLRQLTDQTGFEIIYVAALRAVGVPARLDANQKAEIFADGKWQAAPQPCIMSW